jgi:D-glycero-D-manno-heptose 1,7-bisphosphate phosphatase
VAIGRPAVFIDKDGTLVENVPYNVDPAQIRVMPGAAEALFRMRQQGYALVVVSNQSGIARGLFREAALRRVQRHLQQMLPLDGFYWCPHHPEGNVARYSVECLCRKPRPGMLKRAACDLGIDLAASWLIGDILDDVEAGNRAGARSLLLNNGGETEWRSGLFRTPAGIVHTWNEAADLILGTGQHARGTLIQLEHYR